MTIRAAATSVDITPRRSVALGANGYPLRTFERISRPLEANLLAITSDDGPVVLASFDLLYVGTEIGRSLRARLAEYLGEAGLFLAASHTHRAPAVDRGKPGLGGSDPSYTEWVAEIVGSAIEVLIDSEGSPATLRIGSAQASHSINRRRQGRWQLSRRGIERPGIILGPNPHGPVDERVSRADLHDSGGCPLAVLWHYTCHPTAAPDRLAVNADYPGVVRDRVRRDANVPVLFFQGFSGDTRPPSVARLQDDPLRRVRLGRHFRDFTPAEYEEWAGSLAELVAAIPMTPSPRARVRAVRGALPSSALVRSSPCEEATFHSVAMGRLTLAGVSAEPVVEHGLALRAQFPDVWPVGCIDDVVGYVPTDAQLTEGGYEAGGFCRSFGCSGVNPEAPSRLKARLVHELEALAQSGPAT